MNGTLIALSFAVVMAFFGGMFAFLAILAHLLERTAHRLDRAAATVTVIREHTATIGPAVDSMNQGLYVVAANLSEVADLAEDRATGAG